MLQIEHDTNWRRGRIIMRPHPPSSWRANLWIAGFVAVLTLSFAVGFALAGAILQTLATADFRVEEYHALLPQIQISPL